LLWPGRHQRDIDSRLAGGTSYMRSKQTINVAIHRQCTRPRDMSASQKSTRTWPTFSSIWRRPMMAVHFLRKRTESCTNNIWFGNLLCDVFRKINVVTQI
jgi:hypothetical protein